VPQSMRAPTRGAACHVAPLPERHGPLLALTLREDRMTRLPTQSVQLLVVGAGPVGLFGALCAARRGLEVMVLDQSWQGFGRGYATVLHPRSLRLLREVALLTSSSVQGVASTELRSTSIELGFPIWSACARSYRSALPGIRTERTKSTGATPFNSSGGSLVRSATDACGLPVISSSRSSISGSECIGRSPNAPRAGVRSSWLIEERNSLFV